MSNTIEKAEDDYANKLKVFFSILCENIREERIKVRDALISCFEPEKIAGLGSWSRDDEILRDIPNEVFDCVVRHGYSQDWSDAWWNWLRYGWLGKAFKDFSLSSYKKFWSNLKNKDIADASCAIRSMLFCFKDIASLTNAAVKRLLKETEWADLAKSLKGREYWMEFVRKMFLRNMPSEKGAELKKVIQFMRQIRLADVKESRNKILWTLFRLEDDGEIEIPSSCYSWTMINGHEDRRLVHDGLREPWYSSFSIADMYCLDDHTIKKVVRECDLLDVVKALRGGSRLRRVFKELKRGSVEEIVNLFYSGQPDLDNSCEEYETWLPVIENKIFLSMDYPKAIGLIKIAGAIKDVCEQDVVEARRNILQVIHRLYANGEITITHHDEDELVG